MAQTKPSLVNGVRHAAVFVVRSRSAFGPNPVLSCD
jgi:hypothetical protein